jgi:uncharacterized protein involved in response to NO
MTQAIYAAVVIASLARICASLEPGWSEQLLHVAAFAWTAAFFGFAASFGPLLLGAQLCVPKIRFCNIGGEGRRESGVT